MKTLASRLRRLEWKLGRRLYMTARGETRSNLPASSGELYLQSAVMAAVGAASITVLDVGANKGQWSSQLLSAAPAALRTPHRLQLHAFEPVPATREIYARNLADTPGGDCATLHPLALSDVAGTAGIAIWGETAGTNTLSFDDTSVTKAREVLTISTQTLDGFLDAQGIQAVTLIKIDAEGHDFRILQGGGDTLRTGRVDVVQFEYSHRWIYARCYLRDVFCFIADTDYMLCRIRDDRLEYIEAWHPELERYFDANFALVHPRARSWFSVNEGTFDRSNTYACD